jgi:hypothetical protein
VLGIILGALFVLPLIASPIIQLFWLIALGALYLNLWPGGRGPAWESGEAEPWPSPPSRFAPQPAADEDEPETEAAEPVPASAPNPNTARKRRKKKARR